VSAQRVEVGSEKVGSRSVGSAVCVEGPVFRERNTDPSPRQSQSAVSWWTAGGAVDTVSSVAQSTQTLVKRSNHKRQRHQKESE
jgi:hypothetical protein